VETDKPERALFRRAEVAVAPSERGPERGGVVVAVGAGVEKSPLLPQLRREVADRHGGPGGDVLTGDA